MSEKESNQASLGASDASLPAKNGSRDVEHAPPPLGSEESERDAEVAARTRLQMRLQTAVVSCPGPGQIMSSYKLLSTTTAYFYVETFCNWGFGV